MTGRPKWMLVTGVLAALYALSATGTPSAVASDRPDGGRAVDCRCELRATARLRASGLGTVARVPGAQRRTRGRRSQSRGVDDEHLPPVIVPEWFVPRRRGAWGVVR